MQRTRSIWYGGLLAIALTALPGAALGQTDEERAGARAAASEGAKAFNESRWADAIDLFSRAQSLVKAPPHLLYIARSHEKLGQLVKARENYLQIKRVSLADNAPQPFKDAKQAAETELAALEPRLPYLTVRVQGAGAAAVTVTMDGLAVPAALVGVPRPVDPGKHELQATAKDMASEVVSVTLAEGSKESLALTLLPKPGAGGAGSKDAAARGDDTTRDSGAEGGGSNGMRIGGWVALGVGAVGLGVGTVFALSASSKRSDADDLFVSSKCGVPGECTPAERRQVEALDKDADRAKTRAVIGFAVGGVGVAAGVTLLLLSSKGSGARAQPARVTPYAGYRSAGLVGTF